ncbi:nuclear transport factor 2 family protein [Dehalogenimonas etheniformans]|uniref:Nuclear transport factor 2 family protein n=1 Tax=Dehalogenimonas etheniformans TaxID=1536648 RepID=A0A2P5P6V1_9CHLR|nr:nuclear transport factor 2 family protein [Dehalogenimonas etheniformans]PPD58036.1 nuclear transport factor 2 family protein [Dehalogenimonas etheniformans]QNT75386.1 nuclear transport factor 2 family protein [Dehalogenimonas etheniformans]
MPSLQKQREIVNKFFELIAAQKFDELLLLCSQDCKTHNPYITGGMADLTKAMTAANKEGRAQNPDASFVVRYALVDGNMAAAYTQLLNDKAKPGAGGLRQIHLFRFDEEKIVEYWDVTQQVTPDMPNAGGAF